MRVSLLSFTLLPWMIIRVHSIFYAADYLKFDCLHYYLSNSITPALIPFCFHSNNYSYIERIDNLQRFNQVHTFDELRKIDVTPSDVLSWSAAIDLAEQYEYYLEQQDNLWKSNGVFFNCTRPWFGSRCQYAFEFNFMTSLSTRTDEEIENESNDTFSLSTTTMTCYTLLECNRGSRYFCLDWREVCDGRIDCLNDGIDEANCFDLEINVCKTNECQCHNGLCVVLDSSIDHFGLAKCLDSSDVFDKNECPDTNYELGLLTCEDYSCPPGKNHFSCGDGECVEDYGACQNGRHLLFVKSMSTQGNLSHGCWIAITCLTKILDQVDDIVCEEFLQTNDLIMYLHSCESLLQFPTIPVLFGHVRFLYRPKSISKVNIRLALTPDYICFDEQLCDHLVPTIRYGSYACQRRDELGNQWNMTYPTWKLMIDSLKPHFRGCMTVSRNKNLSDYPLLYRCKNSSKYISKHHINDGISDCDLNDDEQQFRMTTMWNFSSSAQCSSMIKDRSLFVSSDLSSGAIPKNTDLNQILFHQICDQVSDLLPQSIHGRIHTDETDCQFWPCNNIYTRCDGMWQCPNGEDEVHCGQSSCPQSFFDCISAYNQTLMCLPAHQVGDGRIDCLGASDEHHYCRKADFIDGVSYGFRCLNQTKCITFNHICDSNSDCELNDDEALCENRLGLCEESNSYNRSKLDHVLCRIGKARRIAFTLTTVETYPPDQDQQTYGADIFSLEQQAKTTPSDFENFTFASRCHRGIPAYLWLRDDQYGLICFCPPHYYGDRCQYQNDRVSLTLTLLTNNRWGIYTIVVILIENTADQHEVNSYNQFTYVPNKSCRQPFHLYLLYSLRPKNISRQYSVHIDAYDKISLKYLASWYLNVSFLFLPVHRITASLTLPTYPVLSLINCPLTCQQGTCMKYVNQEKIFCKCNPEWSGIQCDIPISYHGCSFDSLSVGMIQNQSICVCPIGKFGSRCHLTLACPPDYCTNNGQCIVIDERMIDTSYICFCPEQFHGNRCQLNRAKLEISFADMEIPPYFIAYMYSYVYFDPPVVVRVLLKKLTLFERSTTLYYDYQFQMVFIKIDTIYYLAVLRNTSLSEVVTSLDLSRRCPPVIELLSPTQIRLPRIQRVKYYHLLCQTYLNMKCFFDEFYLCLCTMERHANCFLLDTKVDFKCEENSHCLNGGQCLQDSSSCGFTTICICTDCFFGDHCQFYAKGFGLTLDDMLRNIIQPNISFLEQTQPIKVWSVLIMILFFVGVVNSLLCLVVFFQRDSRKVGIGLYLLASSITSAFTMTLLIMKFWFVVSTLMNISISRSLFRFECLYLEFVLKIFCYMNSWLNACVAIERAVCVFKGIHYNKSRSKRLARWIIVMLPFLILISNAHELFYRDLFDDPEEQRVWCVTRYSHWTHVYGTTILFFHFVAPVFTNLFSALFIIVTLARQRATLEAQYKYRQHLEKLIFEHKQLIISPLILVILSIPRFIISLFIGCMKASRSSWLYLAGYLISFIPSTALFIVFVLPSKFYMKKFKAFIHTLKQRFHGTI